MNDPKSPRFSRQRRLPEVGEHGQAALCSSEIRVTRTDFVAEIEGEYLGRAGVRVVPAATRDETAEFAHRDCFRFEASASVAEGAWRALRQIVGVLEKGVRA